MNIEAYMDTLRLRKVKEKMNLIFGSRNSNIRIYIPLNQFDKDIYNQINNCVMALLKRTESEKY